MRRLIVVLVTLIAALPLSIRPYAAVPAPTTALELTIRSTSPRFEINEVPTFLLMVSYFDGMDQGGSNINTDLAWLASKGVNGIRVFANWWHAELDGNDFPIESYSHTNTTLCDSDGDLRSGPKDALLGLLDDAKQEGMIVDLTFAAETVLGLTLTEYTACIVEFTEILTNAGSAYKHVFFDVQNEYTKDDNGPSDANPMTEAQVTTLIAAIKSADSGRIVTVSTHQISAANTIAAVDGAGVDIVAFRQDRQDEWWLLTEDAIEVLDNLDLPVYMQEPIRIRPSTNNQAWATAENWAMDAYITKTQGGDAWTLHSGASFELGDWTLQSVMQDEELLFLDCLDDGSVFYDGSCEPPPPSVASALGLSARSVLDRLWSWSQSTFRR